MAYVINKFNGEELIVLEDGTVNTSTSLGLVGRNYVGYGEIQNENFVFLLENFSNEFPPTNPLEGQLWHDSDANTLKLYTNNNWIRVGSTEIGNVAPPEIQGSLWFDTTADQLKIFDESWKLIGPESISGFAETRPKSRSITDSLGNDHAVIEINVNGIVVAIISTEEFTINSSNSIIGFDDIKQGINLSSSISLEENIFKFHGELNGVASSATKLENSRTINGVLFDGQSNITITSNTTGSLKKGSYILGTDFNGSRDTTWNINASSNNIVGSIVARDSLGNFSAGVITSDLVGNVSGNVTSTSGTSTFDVVVANTFVGANLSGNALTATKLEKSILINGTAFDGSRNVTVPADASTLTGTVLSSTVKNSSLESTGILTNLKIKNDGLVVGNNDGFKVYVDTLTENVNIASQNGNKELIILVKDSTQPNQQTKFRFLPAEVALNLGGTNNPSFVPEFTGVSNLGTNSLKWNAVWSNSYSGVGADLAENYSADAEYDPGTVVMFGGSNEVTIAEEETTRVAGVVSENPAYIMNVNLESEYVATIALQGRVKCKVKGPVIKGDMLISCGGGYAKVCNEPKIGQVIGKSVEDFTDDEGFVEVVVGRV